MKGAVLRGGTYYQQSLAVGTVAMFVAVELG